MNMPAIQSSEAPLVIFEDARRQISEAATVDQVNKVLALATGLAAAARKATDKELEAEAAVLKFEAERKLGQLMEQQKELAGFNVGTRGSKVKGARVSEKPTLKDAGIDKNTAHRARKARAVPDAEVEKDNIRARVKEQSATKEKPAPAKSKGSVGSRDIALKSFDAHVLELVRQTRNRKPERFAKTAVAPSDIGKLSSFLFKLSVFLDEVVKERAKREPHEKIGSEESAEKRKAEHAAAEADAEAQS
jgi:hypothetical protein